MKSKKVILAILAIAIFFVIFLLDIISKSFNFTNISIYSIKQILFAFNLIVIYTVINDYESNIERNILTRIGQILILLASNVVLVGVFSNMGNFSFEIIQNLPVHRNYSTLIFSNIITYILIVLSTYIFVVMKIFIFSYKKKNTIKYCNILFSLVILSVILSYLKPAENYYVLTIPVEIAAVIFTLIISFRLPWIMYLTKKEKHYAIIYLLFICPAAIIYIVMASSSNMGSNFIEFTSPFIDKLLSALLVFILIYFTVSFISVIFHLPTQDVYDRKIVEISSLHNLSRLSTQIFSFKELIEEITKLTLTVCEASCAWIEINSEGKNSRFKLAGSVNISFDEIKILYSMENKIYSEKVRIDKKMIYIDNLNYKPLEKKLRSLIAFSLTSHAEIIGILYIGKNQPFGFDKEYFNIISTFANQVTISIENAKLIQKSLEKERMERELLLAQKMQQSLLPQKYPQHPNLDLFANSIPAYEVGGDFYDFTNINENKIGVIVGDVSGKGISAAFYMALIKGMFKSLSTIYESPSDLLKNINKSIHGNIEKKSFVSLIYGVVDLTTGKLTIARAGHCPMLMVFGNDAKFIKPQGLGVGLDKGELFDSSLEQIEIYLEKNSSCIFYTDGITEARNRTGEEFGTQRLFDSAIKNSNLDATNMANNIISDIKQFTGFEKEYDDLTLVVFKWR